LLSNLSDLFDLRLQIVTDHIVFALIVQAFHMQKMCFHI